MEMGGWSPAARAVVWVVEGGPLFELLSFSVVFLLPRKEVSTCAGVGLPPYLAMLWRFFRKDGPITFPA